MGELWNLYKAPEMLAGLEAVDADSNHRSGDKNISWIISCHSTVAKSGFADRCRAEKSSSPPCNSHCYKVLYEAVAAMDPDKGLTERGSTSQQNEVLVAMAKSSVSSNISFDLGAWPCDVSFL